MPLDVCATPIGNLDDVTVRVLRALAEADLVLCEDTRRTRILLDRHAVSARLLSYHRHNEARRTDELLPRLEVGERVALVSDAGLPGINDPGARLIAAALAKSRSDSHLRLADDFVVAVGAVVVEAVDAGRDAPALALLGRLREFVVAQKLEQSRGTRSMERWPPVSRSTVCPDASR